MVDTKKEIKLEFTADTSAVKKAMQEFKAYQQEMGQNARQVSKIGIKSQKELHKVAKKTEKHEKLHRGRKAVEAERKLQKEVKKTTKEIEKRHKAYAGISKQMDHIVSKVKRIQRDAHTGRGGKGGSGGGRGGSGGGRFDRINKGGGAFVGNLLKGIGGLLTTALFGIAGGGFGLLTGQLSGGYQERIQYGRQYGQLAGTGGRLRDLQRQRGFGVHMGMGPIELAQQAVPFARATGQVGGSALRTGIALQRATSLNVGEASQFMGMMTQAGTGFGGKAGKAGKAELIKTLALGVHSGLDRARMPEFFAATTSLVQRQMGASAGNVASSAAGRLLAMLGASGHAGLQGARGGQVAGALDQAIRRPGGGEVGQAFMLQAMGFGKPGGSASYYEALRKQEQGVFGAGNLESMFAETRSQYGGGQAQILALRTLTGLTIDQLEAVRDVVESNMSSEERQAALQKIQAEAKSIEEQALDEMREFGDTTEHMAHLQNRSVGIGDDIKVAVERMEKVLNAAIEHAMPIVVKALEKIADLMESIYNWLKNVLGDLLGNDVEEQFTDRKKKTLEDYENLKKAIREGSISKADAAAEYQRIIGESQSLGMRMHRDVGFFEGVGEGLEQLRADVMRARGVTMPETDRERRNRRQQELQELTTQLMQERSSMMGAGPFARFTPEERRALAAGYNRLSSGQQANWDRLEAQEMQEFNEGGSGSLALGSDTTRLLEQMITLGQSMMATVEETRMLNAGRPPNEATGTTRPTQTGRGMQ